MNTPFERNYHARQIRNFRKILRGNTPQLDLSPSNDLISIYKVHKASFQRLFRVIYYLACGLCILLMLRGCGNDPAWSMEPTDAQYANAIRKAESKNEIRLNINWKSNVKYFLEKEY